MAIWLHKILFFSLKQSLKDQIHIIQYTKSCADEHLDKMAALENNKNQASGKQ